MPAKGTPHLAPFTTPATSDMTLDKHGYELSSVTLGEKTDADTLASNLDVSERRHVSSSPGEESSSSHDGGAREVEGAGEESETQHATELMKEAQAEATEQQEDDTVYPGSWKLAVIMVSLCLSILCFALDVSGYLRSYSNWGWKCRADGEMTEHNHCDGDTEDYG